MLFQSMETARDSGILSVAEKGKETERSTGNSSLFFPYVRDVAASHLGSASTMTFLLPCKRRLIIIFTH